MYLSQSAGKLEWSRIGVTSKWPWKSSFGSFISQPQSLLIQQQRNAIFFWHSLSQIDLLQAIGQKIDQYCFIRIGFWCILKFHLSFYKVNGRLQKLCNNYSDGTFWVGPFISGILSHIMSKNRYGRVKLTLTKS